jgi:hypothetical protein
MGFVMPKTQSETKNSLICTRVTSYIKEIIEQQASREGLTPSEWMRNLIIKELKHENLLQMIFKTPKIKERRNSGRL